MPIACDKCRENLALLIEPKNSNGNAGAFARAAEVANQNAAASSPLLDSAERAELEAHIASCPECARELALMRAMIGELQTLPPAAAPASLQNRIRAEIASGTAAKSQTFQQPSWLAGWRNFFRSPARVAWASGMAMAAFAMIMLRDTPLSMTPPVTDMGPAPSTEQTPIIAARPDTRVAGGAKASAKAGSKAAPKSVVTSGQATPATSPPPRLGLPNDTTENSAKPSAGAPPAPAAHSISGYAGAGVRDQQFEPKGSVNQAKSKVAERAPAMSVMPQTAPAVSPPAAKTIIGSDHSARVRILAGKTAAPAPAAPEFHTFTAPPLAGLPAPIEKGAPPAVEDNNTNGRMAMKSRSAENLAAPGTRPVKPGINSRSVMAGSDGQIIAEDGYGGGSSSDAVISQAPSNKVDPAASTQMYAGAEASDSNTTRSVERTGGPNPSRRPGATLRSGAPPAFSPAPRAPVAKSYELRTDSAEATGIAGGERVRKTDGAPSLSALPVRRTAEVEVSLTPSQDAAIAETRVTLPLGLRFASGPFTRTQTVWRGAVQQKKTVQLHFKVVGVQTGLWPVEIKLQKPDGTKLDAVTVKVTVVP